MRVSVCWLRGVAGAGAGQAGFEVDIHQQGEVGHEAAAGDAVEGDDGVGAEAAAAALVDQAGIREAVGEHDLAAVERRQDAPRPRSARGWRSRAAARRWGGGPGWRHPAGCGGSARRRGVPPGSTVSTTVRPWAAQARGQPVHLGGLAGAVHALESDEEPRSPLESYCSERQPGLRLGHLTHESGNGRGLRFPMFSTERPWSPKCTPIPTTVEMQ